MTTPDARRGSPDVFDFEGTDDDARDWLDTAYGTSLRMTGPIGAVAHTRVEHNDFAVDHLRVDSAYAMDADAMPALVVIDVLGGDIQYTRDHLTDRVTDGGSVLASGWEMPFTGLSHAVEMRTTTLSAELIMAAVEDVAPDRDWHEISFDSYVPHSPAAGARWRATVDQLSAGAPGNDPLLHSAASRLLGHTLLQTFPNNVVHDASRTERDRDARDATPSTVRRAVRIIEANAGEDLSLARLAHECRVTPRSLQYAFREHLDCTPLAYLRRVRLDLARQVLRDATSEQSVSDVANGLGFFNPGRFSAGYREMFDEYPSATLLRSTR